ncbi:MAG: alpha/beta fold hydrolase [Mycobacteriaceae bacterium]|nr:alpha/beta fold hydrolase [Mycobacteriaceae bacterium]
MSRPAQIATSIVATTVLLAGCAPGLAANPRYATDVGGGPRGNVSTPAAPSGPPKIEAPKNDLAWNDCTSKLLAASGATAPVGVTLDCANYDADLDSINGATGTLSIGVVRARSAQTPPDAGPLVFTTGSDLPSSLQLPVWLSRTGADVLKSHPIVAVDRRGMGMSGAIACRDSFDRQEMHNQSQFAAGDDPVANLGAITATATTSCTDTIAPGDTSYDSAHAAEDIERLRSTWDVPAIALLGIGNGAQVALAYAGSHPGKVARLILDSPIPPGINAEGAAEQQVKGQQASLDSFASQCAAAPNCPLGPDPKGAVDALLTAAKAGHGPESVASLVAAITTALAYPHGDRVASTASLAGALATARTGDNNQLTNLVNQAQSMRETDGQFVNGCSDALNRPTPDRVRELVVAWGKLYPQFGAVGALNLVKCLNWPIGTAPPEPKNLKINALLLGGQFDTIAGSDGVAAVSATVINAGAASRRVMWQGIGHGVSIYSPCAVAPVLAYLESGNMPPTDIYCPS